MKQNIHDYLAEFNDIPGTRVYTTARARKGYWVNQFAMSLMKDENRKRWLADEKAYLEEWPMTDEQKQALLDRDFQFDGVFGDNSKLLESMEIAEKAAPTDLPVLIDGESGTGKELMAKVVAENDAVISTAAIPGKKAPILITEEMVSGMKPGSVIVDLAAESGGNCEATVAGEIVDKGGVKIIGPVNVPSSVPYHASQMYAKNIANLLLLMVKDEELNIDLEDEILKESLVTDGGNVVNDRVKESLSL